MPEDPKLRVEDLQSGYGATNVLQGITLSIAAGEILAVMGKNGMGKTTLLKTILGLMPTRRGKVALDGHILTGASPAAIIGRSVGYAPQELPLFQDLSIRDNLRLALRHDRDLPEALHHVKRHFSFLTERLDQVAGTLSGGEQKMLILSRALMLRPALLLIDEISEGVQPSIVSRIASALAEERHVHGTTILLVEQNLGFALGLADRWAVLKLGRIEDEGPGGLSAPARVLEHLSI